MSGETQLRRNLKIDIDKVRDKVGPTDKPTVKVYLHDFSPDSEWSGNPPPIMTNPRTGDRIEVILMPYPTEEG